MCRKIAVTVSNANKTVTPLQTIDAICGAGFRHIFIEWYNKDWPISQAQQLAYARERGLEVLFAHLGYQNINDLWSEDPAADALVERYGNDLAVCRQNGIDLVCMHLTSKTKAPGPNGTGLRRLRAIAAEAERLGVRIAFENTKIRGYQEYVLEHVRSENIGICLDSGHLHAHFDDRLDFEPFRHKIFCVHLHDNFGQEDQHRIPFDGTIDWAWLTAELNRAGYGGPVSMELVYRDDYVGEDLTSFYKRGYAAGEKLVRLLRQNR